VTNAAVAEALGLAAVDALQAANEGLVGGNGR
jgi:hypothetical protein